MLTTTWHRMWCSGNHTQTPSSQRMTDRHVMWLADTATEAAAAATKRRLLGAVSQAERRATSLAKKVKLVSEAVGQDFTTPEGRHGHACHCEFPFMYGLMACLSDCMVMGAAQTTASCLDVNWGPC